MGTIFNVQKFCVSDGPGIRTTVFFKGCPLSCVWCHNPESKKTTHELFYNRSKCTGCGECVAVCSAKAHSFESDKHKLDRSKCIMCGKCADVCLTGALEMTGEEITVDEVIDIVMEDEAFYKNSNGGITLSGGEPMLQFDFAIKLLEAAKTKGLHTCMETCGFSTPDNYREIAPFVDIFLFDYKITDREQHNKYTGVYNDKIIENLKMLDKLGCKIILRCPIIPTINDNDSHFAGIAQTANSLKNILEVNIEPYHPLGKSKSDYLDKDYILGDLSFPESETVNEWIRKISSMTSVTIKLV